MQEEMEIFQRQTNKGKEITKESGAKGYIKSRWKYMGILSFMEPRVPSSPVCNELSYLITSFYTLYVKQELFLETMGTRRGDTGTPDPEPAHPSSSPRGHRRD